MKVAILSESSADEAAIRVLIDSLLGSKTQPVSFPSLRTRGWRGVLNTLPAILKYLHYNDADAFVAVLDSDESPIHRVTHEMPGGSDGKCRLCRLRELCRVQEQLRPRSGRPGVKIALGVASPAIEAWYRCGLDPRVSETTWILGLQSKSYPYTKLDLKKDVYGTDRSPLALKTLHATTAAQRLSNNLELLNRLFPTGFGALRQDVQSWLS